MRMPRFIPINSDYYMDNLRENNWDDNNNFILHNNNNNTHPQQDIDNTQASAHQNTLYRSPPRPSRPAGVGNNNVNTSNTQTEMTRTRPSRPAPQPQQQPINQPQDDDYKAAPYDEEKTDPNYNPFESPQHQQTTTLPPTKQKKQDDVIVDNSHKVIDVRSSVSSSPPIAPVAPQPPPPQQVVKIVEVEVPAKSTCRTFIETFTDQLWYPLFFIVICSSLSIMAFVPPYRENKMNNLEVMQPLLTTALCLSFAGFVLSLGHSIALVCSGRGKWPNHLKLRTPKTTFFYIFQFVLTALTTVFAVVPWLIFVSKFTEFHNRSGIISVVTWWFASFFGVLALAWMNLRCVWDLLMLFRRPKMINISNPIIPDTEQQRGVVVVTK